MTEVLENFARSNAQKPQKQTINLVTDGEVVGSAQAEAGQKNAALAFGGDFFGE
jgi:hypothetical protein